MISTLNIRLEPREDRSVFRMVLALVGAVLTAMAVCSLLILWGGASPLEGWALMLRGSLGSAFALSETLTRATPLIFTGLAAATAFRAKL
ncbi:MAG: ABC transporter permease, partial [Desulfobacterales bacterium]|nr:ABC transporter permease [Desulfobacterales bacterium]